MIPMQGGKETMADDDQDRPSQQPTPFLCLFEFQHHRGFVRRRRRRGVPFSRVQW